MYRQVCLKFRRGGSSRGAAMVELTIVLPVLLSILIGLAILGNVIAQIAWMSQTGYLIYQVGADVRSNTAREIKMEDRFVSPIYGLIGGNQELSRTAARATNLQMIPLEDVGGVPETVGVQVQGSLGALIGVPSLFPIDVQIVGPLIAPDDYAEGDLNQFQDPNPLFKCDGTPCEASDPPTCGLDPCMDSSSCTREGGEPCECGGSHICPH